MKNVKLIKTSEGYRIDPDTMWKNNRYIGFHRGIRYTIKIDDRAPYLGGLIWNIEFSIPSYANKELFGGNDTIVYGRSFSAHIFKSGSLRNLPVYDTVRVRTVGPEWAVSSDETKINPAMIYHDTYSLRTMDVTSSVNNIMGLKETKGMNCDDIIEKACMCIDIGHNLLRRTVEGTAISNRIESEDVSPILQFKGDYDFMSNFYPCEINYKGETYHSAEAAYQAQFCEDPADRKMFVNLSPQEAQELGREMKSKYPEQKYHDLYLRSILNLRSILREKFSHFDLAEKLLNTGDKLLINMNDCNDNKLGVYNMEGENILGDCLEGIRDNLRYEETNLQYAAQDLLKRFKSVDECTEYIDRASAIPTSPNEYDNPFDDDGNTF